MRCALLCAAAFCATLPAAVATAQVTTFPYEAVVETDGVPIHSGPGFYATNRLKQGAHVIVQRHDPGGWYMITPPAGEFSLVETSALTQLGGGTAEIVAEEAPTRVGSRVGKDFSVEQIPLLQGERVTLMAGVPTPEGWTAIQPPRGEYRWISGRFLVPVLPDNRMQHDADPFAVPSIAKRPDSFDEIVVAGDAEAPSLAAEESLAPQESKTAGSSDSKHNVADTLRRLDRQLEGLTLSEPTEWPLDMLAIEYKRLQNQSPSLSRQIDVRLAQIERMRFVQKQYTDYVQLTSATDERDALLLARQESAPRTANFRSNAAAPVTMASAPKPFPVPAGTAVSPVPTAPPAEPVAKIDGPVLKAPEVAATPHAIPSTPAMSPPPQIQPRIAPPATAQNQPMPSRQTTGPQPQRFEAVGIVQKAVDARPGAPQYVLVAPNGRILVYLQEPKGVSFEGFVGQPMGVNGARQNHPQTTTPMIAVQTLTPVRL
jgi:hypothetical protein